jgi:hypothetical protein
MTSRIDALGNPRDPFTPELPPILPQRRTADPHPESVLTIDENLRNFIEAARAEERASELAQLGGALPSPADIDAQRGASIRAFFNRFDIEVPVLAGAPGETRRVAVPFRISLDDIEGHAKNLRRALEGAPSQRYVGYVVAGRPTPEQLIAVVNDLARLHPEEFAPNKNAEDVRNYLRRNGVGIDCAGSVQLAFFDCHGLSPQAGRERFGLKIRLNEDLSNLRGKRGIAELRNPKKLRPGDLVILKKPADDAVGHTVIVTDRSVAPLTPEEAAILSRYFPELATPGKEVVRVSVASSFGGQGPQERKWIFDPATKKWGDLGGQLFDDDGHGHSTSTPGPHSGPWNHDIEGMYHAD